MVDLQFAILPILDLILKLEYMIFTDSELIGIMVKVFANGQGDQGSIPGWVILKTQKMVLVISLLNTQHYKVWIKGQVKQSRKRNSTLLYT